MQNTKMRYANYFRWPRHFITYDKVFASADWIILQNCPDPGMRVPPIQFDNSEFFGFRYVEQKIKKIFLKNRWEKSIDIVELDIADVEATKIISE